MVLMAGKWLRQCDSSSAKTSHTFIAIVGHGDRCNYVASDLVATMTSGGPFGCVQSVLAYFMYEQSILLTYRGGLMVPANSNCGLFLIMDILILPTSGGRKCLKVRKPNVFLRLIEKEIITF